METTGEPKNLITPKGQTDKLKSQQEKRQTGMMRHVERIIAENPSLEEQAEREIQVVLDDLPAAELATRIYENIVSCFLEKKAAEKDQKISVDPYLISELKLLWHDQDARQLFLERYSLARMDARTFRLSELGKELRNLEKEITAARDDYQKFKQDLNLRRVANQTALKATERQFLNHKKLLEKLLRQEQRLMALAGFEQTQENTDAAAMIMYETLMRYHQEAKPENGGFAWLLSRTEIHKKAIAIVETTGKSPLLIGPPGTGKTSQINAIARELTGEDALRIPCHSGLSEEGLIANRDIKGGEGTYDYHGTIAEAFTGFLHSRDEKPAYAEGRIVNLDEISQLNLDRALGPIKDIRQAKTGQPLSRYVSKPVLPGSFLTATSNSPITDERLDREFSQVRTNYFEMSETNPELYEFMLAKLLNDEGHLPAQIKLSELSPFWEKKDLTEDKRRVLTNKEVVIAVSELESNRADKRHGYLYRLAYATRSVQDAYIEGSRYNEKHMVRTAFYFNFDDQGNTYVTDYLSDVEQSASPTGGGERLVLGRGSSTVTAEMIAYWMEGFRLSGEKSLQRYIQKILKDHIDQTSSDDGERLKLIFDYFYLLDQSETVREDIQPLTPKEIGYLSPRAPRPVYVEKPKKEDQPPAKEDASKEPEEYETTQVRLESGESIFLKKRDFQTSEIKIFETEDGNTIKENNLIPIGTTFRIKTEDFILAGVVEDPNHPDNGKPIGKPASEEPLYRIFTPQELDRGILNYEYDALIKDIAEKEQAVEVYISLT